MTQTTLFEDDLLHLYYDHDNEEYKLTEKSPTETTETVTERYAERLVEVNQVASTLEELQD